MSGKMLSYENFFERLRSEVPSFSPIYEEHVKDNDELLPHVLMGELERYIRELYYDGYKVGNEKKRKILLDVLGILEKGMLSPDEKLQELISVSFLNCVGSPDEDEIRALLGPALSQELEAIESWRP